MSLIFSNLRVLKNIECAQNWYELELSLANIDLTIDPRPGQFVSFGFSNLSYRRPFAVSAYLPKQSFSVLYQVLFPESSNRINASTQMSTLQTNDTIDTMMFHGNGFPLPPDSHTAVLVGGGIGLGPLLFFAHALKAKSRSIMIVGARSKELIPIELIQREGLDTQVCTDDGSMGHKGTVIHALEDRLTSIDNPVVYFCGPTKMMHKGAMLCKERSITSYVSLDCIMACANGACVGCVVPSIDTHVDNPIDDITWKKSCISGPVYNSNEIVWEKM